MPQTPNKNFHYLPPYHHHPYPWDPLPTPRGLRSGTESNASPWDTPISIPTEEGDRTIHESNRCGHSPYQM